MSHPVTASTSEQRSKFGHLWQSGMIFTAASFVAGLGNYAFQAIISRNLAGTGEFGLANSTLSFTQFLSLPVLIATFAVTHYIARFHSAGDSEQLNSLIAGCRRFLFRLTIGGSILALLLIKPLSQFFNFPRLTLLAAVLCSVWAGLWGSFGTTLCQGLGWFKRLALIALLIMVLRLTFGGIATSLSPTAEFVVLATAVGTSANLILLFWRKELVKGSLHPESPWTSDFRRYLLVAAACVGGSYFFLQGDQLVAKRHFSESDLDAFAAAGVLARALPLTVGPLLTVLFTHRSGEGTEGKASDHLKLLVLYAGGLLAGALMLYFLRELCLKIIGRNTPLAADMILPFAFTMVFAGLLNALALWALASRWLGTALSYGLLGVLYWTTLLIFGTSPDRILKLMPMLAGTGFVILLVLWLIAAKRTQSVLNFAD